MRIEILDDSLHEAYDAYLLSQPAGMLYQSSRFKGFLKALLGCEESFLVALEGGDIRGVLPLMKMKREIGQVYNALPFYGSNAGVLTDSCEAYQSLADAYNELIRSAGTLASTLITNPLLPQDGSGIAYHYTSSRIGQFTDLSPLWGKDWDGVMNHFDPSIRWDVKKAISKGIQVEIDVSHMDRLREMHQENMVRVGVPAKSDAFFAGVPHYFKPDDYNLYVAKLDGEVISALLAFYFNRTAEYYVPATDVNYRSLQPSSLVLMRAIADAATRGFQWWNWGGTQPNLTGVYHFKRKWAGVDRPYTYYTYVNDEALLDMSPAAIGQNFPNFFVVPFSALKQGVS